MVVLPARAALGCGGGDSGMQVGCVAVSNRVVAAEHVAVAVDDGLEAREFALLARFEQVPLQLCIACGERHRGARRPSPIQV